MRDARPSWRPKIGTWHYLGKIYGALPKKPKPHAPCPQVTLSESVLRSAAEPSPLYARILVAELLIAAYLRLSLAVRETAVYLFFFILNLCLLVV